MMRSSLPILSKATIRKPPGDGHQRIHLQSRSSRRPLGIIRRIRTRLWQKISYILAVCALSLALWGGPLVSEASAVITVLPGTGAITRKASKQGDIYSRPGVQKQQVKGKAAMEKKKKTGESQPKKKAMPDFVVPSVLSRLEAPSMKNRPTKSSLSTSAPKGDGKSATEAKGKPEKQELASQAVPGRGLPGAASFVVVTGSGVMLGLSGGLSSSSKYNSTEKLGSMGALKEESVKLLFKGKKYAGTVATKVSEQGEIVKQVVAEEWKRSGEFGNPQ